MRAAISNMMRPSRHKYAMDPFKQSKLMKAYEGMRSVELPAAPDIDNLADLKKLAGVTEDASYGATTSAYASDLHRIARERGIKPGDAEWFRLYFAKPLLTKEQPYDNSGKKGKSK